jgi:hypothetical protein
MFANALMRVFQQQSKTIVYENQLLGRRFLLPPSGPIFSGDVRAFTDELEDRANVYICDCGKLYVSPKVSKAFTIVLSSPSFRHYENWLTVERKILLLYMPLWSLEEMQAVIPAIYPPRQSAKRDMNGDVVTDASGQIMLVDLYEQRFDVSGGHARFVFSPETDESDFQFPALKSRIEGCDLPTMIRTATSNLVLNRPEAEITWQLLRIDLTEDAAGNPLYQTHKLDYASDHILGRLAARTTATYQSQIMQLLQETSGYGDAAVLRAKFLERFSVGMLANGGIFRARWLNDANATDLWLNFISTRQRGIQSNLQHLQYGVSSIH